MGTNVRQNIVTNGLVMYLDAGSRMSYPGSGTTWTDLSGQRNTGTLTNGPTFNTANQGNIIFTQSSTYVACGNILNYTTSDFSFSYWVKISNFTTSVVNQGPIIFYKGAFQQNGYYNQIYGDGSIYLHTNQASANQVTGTTAPEIVGDWSNIAFTRSGSSVRVYVNGVDKTTSAGVHINPASSANVFTINAYQVGGANIFGNIQLANFMNYNRALSAQEVTQNYNATKTRFGLT